MDKKKTRQIIAREGLIISGIISLGLLIIGINMVANSIFVKTYMYIPLENKLDFKIISYANYDNINVLGYTISLFGYPLYLLIRFIIWAIRELRER